MTGGRACALGVDEGLVEGLVSFFRKVGRKQRLAPRDFRNL